jgi:sporulation protein YlmC with PRC-barrel domain
MLRSANDLHGFSIGATDGDVGQIEAFYFDPLKWTVCSIEVNAGGWLSPRKLLLSNLNVDATDWYARTIETDLTREEVKRSPRLGVAVGGLRRHKGAGTASIDDVAGARSTKEIAGGHIAANDGAIGHVEDVIIDDETWTIRYIVIDTRNWWPGKKVIIAPAWVSRVDWRNRRLHVDLSRREIQDSPEYDDSSAIDRKFEERLHEHYKQPGYWSESR